MNNNYIVYKHTAPNGKIYIGITQQEPKSRWKNGTGYRTQILFFRAIKKYGWNNFKHEILYKNLSQEDAEIKEKELIRLYKSNYAEYGYNVENGGNSIGKHSEEVKRKIGTANTGKIRSEETLKKLSVSHKGIYPSEETRKKLSKVHKGKIVSNETRKKMSESRKGLKLSEETKKKLSAIKLGKNTKISRIYQYALNGELLATYDSVTEVFEKCGKFQHIYDCFNGKRKTAHGFVWQCEVLNNG